MSKKTQHIFSKNYLFQILGKSQQPLNYTPGPKKKFVNAYKCKSKEKKVTNKEDEDVSDTARRIVKPKIDSHMQHDVTRLCVFKRLAEDAKIKEKKRLKSQNLVEGKTKIIQRRGKSTDQLVERLLMHKKEADYWISIQRIRAREKLMKTLRSKPEISPISKKIMRSSPGSYCEIVERSFLVKRKSLDFASCKDNSRSLRNHRSSQSIYNHDLSFQAIQIQDITKTPSKKVNLLEESNTGKIGKQSEKKGIESESEKPNNSETRIQMPLNSYFTTAKSISNKRNLFNYQRSQSQANEYNNKTALSYLSENQIKLEKNVDYSDLLKVRKKFSEYSMLEYMKKSSPIRPATSIGFQENFNKKIKQTIYRNPRITLTNIL